MMSDEQFRFIGARFDDLERHMKVLAEANLMTRECLSVEIQPVNQRIDGLEANLGRFAGRVFDRFEKLENRFDKFETETAKRFDKLETEGAETRHQLEALRDDTQQRLKRIEDSLALKSSPSSRTPPRATRTSLTKRLK